MILPLRSYEREAPRKDAKSVYIFCEGKKREYQYFSYFRGLDSRINIKVYELEDHDDNSPLGLLNIAIECFTYNSDKSGSEYSFVEGDEVWIVLDRDKDKLDSRAPQISKILMECSKREGWYMAVSNPCFEVWLYYHKFSVKPVDISDKPSWWKQKVAEAINGGFDSHRHPLLIETARNNAKDNFKLVDEKPDVGCTEVYKLANTILPLVKEKLDKALNGIK